MLVCPDTALQCALAHRPINPSGPKANPLLFIVGEAPGGDEERFGEFFVGKSGMELTNYLQRAQIPRDLCYITNILKCRPPGNRDPYAGEVNCCTAILERELAEVNPRIIVSVGRYATRWFLGDVDMEMVHGVPHKWKGKTVIPVYHPSAGLHDTVNMSLIMADFLAVRAVVKGTYKPVLKVSHGNYQLVPDNTPPYLSGDVVAVDTETEEDGKSWCLSYSCDGLNAGVIMADNMVALAVLNGYLSQPHVTTVLHNAMFDLPKLAQMGIFPAHVVDTMIMAYLLQTEPQGLKPLAFRHLGLKMNAYEDMVGPMTQILALQYLSRVAEVEWPKPDPVLEEAKGVMKIRQPQALHRKVKALLTKWGKIPEEVDLFDGWHKMEGIEEAEAVYGKLHPAYLKDIDFHDAVQYSGEDAYATYHLYWILEEKINALDLGSVVRRDMGAVEMVADMQDIGILVDKPYFAMLRDKFTGEMETLRAQIERLAGHPVNPGSDQQVFDLLLQFHLATGKPKKGSTDRAKLESLAHRHPIIPLISQWKAYSKLISSFVDVVPAKTSADGRIRTTLRVTRVVTGRLSSSKPNLMAQPVRTEEGRMIRGGFVASPGCSLVSGDYSQVEMRVVAHDSQDPIMMEIFQSGKDIHAETASNMFGLPVDKLDDMLHRYPAKRVGFGILNQISPEKLLREMEVGGATGWTLQKTQDLIIRWFATYQGVAEWIEGKKVEARRTGMVRDMFGRMRLVPEILSVHKQIVEAGLRQAVNAPIQMGAQGVIKEAMGQLVPFYKMWRDMGYVCNPLLQIHDDLVWEVSDEILAPFIAGMKDTMEHCVQLLVPLKVDIKVGKKWMGMEKWKIK